MLTDDLGTLDLREPAQKCSPCLRTPVHHVSGLDTSSFERDEPHPRPGPPRPHQTCTNPELRPHPPFSYSFLPRTTKPAPRPRHTNNGDFSGHQHSFSEHELSKSPASITDPTPRPLSPNPPHRPSPHPPLPHSRPHGVLTRSAPFLASAAPPPNAVSLEPLSYAFLQRTTRPPRRPPQPGPAAAGVQAPSPLSRRVALHPTRGGRDASEIARPPSAGVARKATDSRRKAASTRSDRPWTDTQPPRPPRAGP